MATTKKRGDAYQITVSCGYDLTGKQIRRTMTWKPEPGMTARQIEKELNRQSVLFEERVNHNIVQDGNIKTAEFFELFLTRHGPNLKHKTLHGYRQLLGKASLALGHIKLKDLKPGHIADFYANLQEEGMRERTAARFRGDFAAWMQEQRLSMAELSRRTGVTVASFRRLKEGRPIAEGRAKSIADGLGVPYERMFRRIHDDTPLKPGTIHAYHRAVSAALSKAVAWKYIDHNPAAGAVLPSIARRRAAYLDEPDARYLLEQLQTEHVKWRAVITFDLFSGLRRAELLGLRWSDLDLDSQIVHVRQTWNYVPEAGCYIDTPKTEDGERTLRISRSAVVLLLEYRRWQQERRDQMGDAWLDRDDRVFTNDNGSPLFPDTVTKWFTQFVARNELPKITLHSLRHTYASLMIADKVPLVVVAHSLGHAQTSTTANIYAHVISAAEIQAVEVIDRFADAFNRSAGEPADNTKAASGE